jgi:hypothetical protein
MKTTKNLRNDEVRIFDSRSLYTNTNTNTHTEREREREKGEIEIERDHRISLFPNRRGTGGKSAPLKDILFPPTYDITVLLSFFFHFEHNPFATATAFLLVDVSLTWEFYLSLLLS